MCLNKKRVDCCVGCKYLNYCEMQREWCDDFMMEGKISEGQYLKAMNNLKEQWIIVKKEHKRIGCTDHHSSDDEDEEFVLTPFEWRGIQYIRDDEGNLYNSEAEIVGRALNGLVTIF